jgi:membrane protease YdiL (CAAX protease family)
MRRFYFDPIFIVLLTIPIPFWLFLKPDHLPLAADQITALITLSLLYPILEELIFRGYLQPWIKTKSDRKFFNLSTANILTSVIF